MTTITFDTLKFAERLEAGGFTLQQSRAAAEAFADATSQELAAKGDLRDIRTEITALRSDMEKMEMRLTIKMGAMPAAAVAAVAATVKLL